MKGLNVLLQVACIGLFVLSAKATHIVGGELELQYISGNNYRLNLVVYFDEINGQQGAIDGSARIDFFAKRNHAFIESFTIPLVAQTRVNYTQIACTIGFLSTRRLLYSQIITLQPSRYADPEGYYLSYERCCRNNIIENIFRPQDAGQAFYLEIPPLIRNGQRFINSSPSLFPPLSDYACVGAPFYFDFGGQDADGDSLVYSLSVPLNGNTTPQNPVNATPLPGPYAPVIFIGGHSLNNMIMGNPPLRIDAKTGFITITPSRNGLFVFAIRCEEYRNGQKIGEVRRDYQMLVLNCPPIAPPVIRTVKDKNGNLIDEQNPATFVVGSSESCLEISVTDPNPNTFITPRIIPIQPKEDFLKISGNFSVALQPTQTLKFDVCLDPCKVPTDSLYKFLLLVGDNSCALPLNDTIPITVKLIDNNTPPDIVTSLPFNAQQQYYEATVTVGEKFSFDIEGIDADQNVIEILAKSNDNTILSLLGIPATVVRGVAPQKATVEFLPSCQLLTAPNFEPKDYFIDLIIRDFNACNVLQKQKTVTVKIRVLPAEIKNKPPTIQPTILNMVGKKVFTDSVLVGETIIFDLIGNDEDNDELLLDGKGINVDLSTLEGLTFEPVQGKGLVRTRFAWTPTCAHLDESFQERTYLFLFTVADKVDCLKLRQDSLRVELKVYDKPSLPLTPFPNVFTPNGDNVGDVFYLKNLPIDNCADEFVSITIVNRWGEEIFYSENRNFAWRAEGFPSGMYFYFIKYKNKVYKGTINLLRG